MPVNLIKKCCVSGLLALFFLLIIDLAAVFSFHQLYQASQKPFWGDEIHGLRHSIHQADYHQLLLKGANGQGSPSPLDYVAVKVLDDVKERVNYFGLTDEVYFRLFANGVTAFAAVWVILLFAFYISKQDYPLWIKCLQYCLLLGVPFAFYFTRHVYYYAAEVRPYALWNSLWLVVLAGFLVQDKHWRWFIVSLYLLALTATASLFQIGALTLAYLLWNVRTENIKTLLARTARIFIGPLCVAFYYALYAGHWHYPDNPKEWPQFLELWSHEGILLAFMVGGILLCLFHKDNRRLAVIPLAVILLYCMAPFIFFITKMKGFFYTDRQYIYFDLTQVIFLLIVIRTIPAYLQKIKNPGLACVAFVIILWIGQSAALRPKNCDKFRHTLKNAWELYCDPSPIQRPF